MAGKTVKATVALNGKVESSLESSAKKAEESLSGIEKACKALEKLEVGKMIVQGLQKVGEMAVEAGKYLVDLGTQYDQAFNQLSASTGITGAEMDALAASMENVYANNFGDSLADVGDGMSLIYRNTQLTGEALESATESAFLMRDVFGYDIAESSRTASALMNNFGIEAEEAYGIMAHAAQNGADQNGDLLDTLNEYSVHFKTMGFGAEEFATALETGAQRGVFSVDKVGDAFKEFTIRAKDGSDGTAEAFTSIGLEAEAMSEAFAAGGDQAHEAFFQVVDALSAMEDPLAKNAAGVALFGTMYEDLESDILPIMASMRDGAIDTTGTLEQMNEVRYDDLSSSLEGVKRQFETALRPLGVEMSNAFNSVMPAISEAIDGIAPMLQGLSDSLAPFMQSMAQTMASAIGNLAPVIVGILDTVLPILTELIGGILPPHFFLQISAPAKAGAFLLFFRFVLPLSNCPVFQAIP